MIVAAVGIAVSSDKAERKRRLEAAAREAVLTCIAEWDRAGTGFPPDAVLREAQRVAIERAR